MVPRGLRREGGNPQEHQRCDCDPQPSSCAAPPDPHSLSLDRGLTLKVDDSTEIVGVDSSTSGISALHEGQQVRASYDSSSNSAKKAFDDLFK